MAIQILQPTPTFGEQFGSGLGTGLGAGLQALAQYKLQQYGQQQEQKRKAAGIQALMPNLSPSQAESLASVDPRFIQEYMKQQYSPKIQTGLTKEQQKAVDKRFEPYIKDVQKESKIAQEAIPLLNELQRLDETGEVGGGLGGYFKGKAGQEYQSIIDTLEAKGFKGLPQPSQNVNVRKKLTQRFIKELQEKLRHSDVVNDVLDENEGVIPPNLTRLIDQRMNVRSQQQPSQEEITPQEQIPQTIPQEAQQEQMQQLLGTLSGQQQIPGIQPEPGDGIEDILGAGARTIGRGLTGLVGGLGETLGVLPNIASYVSGQELPDYEKIQEKVPFLPPTTKQIQQYIGEEKFKPKTRAEEAIGTILEEAGSLVSPGGAIKGLGKIAKGLKIAGNIPKYLKSAEKFIKIAPKAALSITAAGTATKEALKSMGASDLVQNTGKLMSSLLASGATSIFAKKNLVASGKQVEKAIEKLPKTTTTNSLKDNWKALKDAREALNTKGITKKETQSLNNIIKSIQPRVDKLVDKFPTVKTVIKDAKDLEKIANVSSGIHNFSRKYLLRRQGVLGLAAFLRVFGLSRGKLILPGAPTIAVAGQIEKAVKMAKLSPAFMKQYGDILKAGLYSAAQIAGRESVKKEK